MAIELAQNSEFLILAMDANAANVTKAKQVAAEAGMRGRKLHIEKGTAQDTATARN